MFIKDFIIDIQGKSKESLIMACNKLFYKGFIEIDDDGLLYPPEIFESHAPRTLLVNNTAHYFYFSYVFYKRYEDDGSIFITLCELDQIPPYIPRLKKLKYFTANF